MPKLPLTRLRRALALVAAGARRVPFVFLPFVLVVTLAGCSHYQLGTGAKPSFRTLYIAPVENATMLPQARALLSTQLREAFVRDGRVMVVNSAEGADASLRVTIQEYRRDVAAVREGDTGLARKFNLVLSGVCTLRDNRAGTTLFEARPISTLREAFTDAGQLQAEYQTLPLLGGALADKVVHAALDVW